MYLVCRMSPALRATTRWDEMWHRVQQGRRRGCDQRKNRTSVGPILSPLPLGFNDARRRRLSCCPSLPSGDIVLVVRDQRIEL